MRFIKDGYFSVAYVLKENEEETGASSPTLLPFIVDPLVVFDQDSSLSYPTAFFQPDAPSALARRSVC